MFEPHKYDLILTDRCMPEMNGDLFAVKIKQLGSQIPVLMVTGVGELMSGYPAGVDMVVSKPVNRDILRSAIWRMNGMRRKRQLAASS